MQTLLRIGRKLIGLFIDSGSLAATVLGWIVVCGVPVSQLLPNSAWQGPILFIGVALILVESALRGAKARSYSG